MKATEIQDFQPTNLREKQISLRVWLGDFCLFFCCFFLCFPLSFYVFYVFICVVFDCKCKSLKRLGENITKQKETLKQTKEKLKEKQQKNRNTGYPAHEPPRKINISKGLAWRFLFFFMFVFMFSFELFYVLCFYMCFCSIVNAKA